MGIAEHSAEAARQPVLDLRGISKTFGAVRAVRRVDLQLFAGEVLGLVGDNGAGKSTLVNIVAGTLSPDHGEIVVKGQPHVHETPADARRAGIETVFQSLSLIPALDIAENIYLGRESFALGRVGQAVRLMDKRRMRREAVNKLEAFGLRLPPPTTKVAALSGGQRQAVAVARAVFWGSEIVLMDEPTAALGVRQTELVLGFVERLKAHGVGVLLISHNMQQVLRVCDRIIVMRLGEKVVDTRTADITVNDLVAAITGVAEWMASVRGSDAPKGAD